MENASKDREGEEDRRAGSTVSELVDNCISDAIRHPILQTQLYVGVSNLAYIDQNAIAVAKHPHNHTIPTPAPSPTTSKVHPNTILPNRLPWFGAFFCVSCCPCALQLSAPQLYPLGQQPPPSPAGQSAHPFAQLSPPVVAAATVASLPWMIVVVSCAGQDVVSQFRSTRQQPPR